MATGRRAATRIPEETRQRRPSILVWVASAVGLAVVILATAWLLRLAGDGSSSAAGGSKLSNLYTSDFHSLAISPVDANLVLFGHHGGVMVSGDGGRRWAQSGLTEPTDDAMGIGFSSADPLLVFAAGHDTFFKSVDGGLSWTPVQTGLPRADIHASPLCPVRRPVFWQTSSASVCSGATIVVSPGNK